MSEQFNCKGNHCGVWQETVRCKPFLDDPIKGKHHTPQVHFLTVSHEAEEVVNGILFIPGQPATSRNQLANGAVVINHRELANVHWERE